MTNTDTGIQQAINTSINRKRVREVANEIGLFLSSIAIYLPIKVIKADIASLGLVGDSLALGERAISILDPSGEYSMVLKANGQSITINPDKDLRAQLIVRSDDEMVRARQDYWREQFSAIMARAHEEYMASPEYADAQKKQNDELEVRQNRLTTLLYDMDVVFPALAPWARLEFLLKFVILADRIGIKYDQEYVINVLESCGYVRNQFAGPVFKGSIAVTSLLNRSKYVVGQVLDFLYLNEGFPSIVMTFLEDLSQHLRAIDNPKAEILDIDFNLFIGVRDKKRNTDHEGKWMICEIPDLRETTKDASTGGYCIVGDDLSELIDEAFFHFTDGDSDDSEEDEEDEESSEGPSVTH